MIQIQARVSARPGLTYFDANMGRLVTEGPDVCDYKSRIRADWPELDCYYDVVQEEWIVTQKDQKGQETFILADQDLARAYKRLQRARNDAPGAMTATQLNEWLEREQDKLREKDMEGFREVARDAAERLMVAFRKDGILDHENIYGPKPKKHLHQRDVRIR